MQETYSTYTDSIQEALRQGPGDGSGDGMAAPAVAAAAEAAVNGSQPAAAGAAGGAASPPTPLAVNTTLPQHNGKAAAWGGSPYAQQLWQRWFRDVSMVALLLVSLWLMRRAVEGAADGLASGGGGTPPGLWQGRRVVFRQDSLLPLLRAKPQAV